MCCSRHGEPHYQIHHSISHKIFNTMKRITLLFAFVIAAMTLSGQGIVDKYYTDLEAQENTTSVYVSSAMFSMAAKLDIETDDQEFNDLKEFVNSVQSFSLIKVPELHNPVSYYKEGIRKIDDTHQELVRVKDQDTRISVYVAEQNDVIYEVAVLGVVDGDFLAASLVGEMDLDQVSEFISKAQGESFEALTTLKETGVADMKLYPNPSASGTLVSVDVPAALVGGTAVVYDMEGIEVARVPASNSTIGISTDDLPTGGYIVELSNGSTSIKQKMIVLD